VGRLVLRDPRSNHHLTSVMMITPATPPMVPPATALVLVEGLETDIRHRRASHCGGREVEKKEDFTVEDSALRMMDCTEIH
jgi:hypothetical protein